MNEPLPSFACQVLSNRPGWRSIVACEVLFLVVLACVVYGYRLGTGGLINTEGHRVAPAWEMLDTGEIWTQRLFGQIYLRKPPGHAWAIALSTLAVGRNEWAPRLVGALSGVGMVLLAYFFARRWFGTTAGLPAGLAQLLMPIFWKFQRSAEIEGLLNLLSQMVILATLEILLCPRDRDRIRHVVFMSMATLGFVLGFLVKGPAIAAVWGGSLIAVVSLKGFWSVIGSRPFWMMFLTSFFAVGTGMATIAHFASASHEEIVLERVFGFEWSWSILAGMLLLIPKAIVLALPGSFALLAPWMSARETPGRGMALGVAIASIASVLIFMLVGLTNERYTVPAFTVVSLLVGFAWSARSSWELSRNAERWGRTLAGALGVLLVVGWMGYVGLMEARLRATSGKEQGFQLARILPDGATLWSDGMIDARPETLLYAQMAAKNTGKKLTVRWRHQPSEKLPLPDVGGYVLLRTDGVDSERDRHRDTPGLSCVTTGKVYKYPFELLHVESPSSPINAMSIAPRPVDQLVR
ncbi:glycosyltransferase family 39 protein [bacterium]|nr:glycosyltransferase family 39 protein [bacterium]